MAAMRLAVALLLALTALVVPACSDDTREAQTYLVEIPAGTAERQKAGEEMKLLPSTLTLQVGDTLKIDNQDAAYQTVGPYDVGPGQTLVQTFQEPGEIRGLCTLHPSGEVTIVIEES